MAVRNLVRLAVLTGDTTLRERAARILAAFRGDLERVPFGFSSMLGGLDLLRDEDMREVVFDFPWDDEIRERLRAALQPQIHFFDHREDTTDAGPAPREASAPVPRAPGIAEGFFGHSRRRHRRRPRPS